MAEKYLFKLALCKCLLVLKKHGSYLQVSQVQTKNTAMFLSEYVFNLQTSEWYCHSLRNHPLLCLHKWYLTSLGSYFFTYNLVCSGLETSLTGQRILREITPPKHIVWVKQRLISIVSPVTFFNFSFDSLYDRDFSNYFILINSSNNFFHTQDNQNQEARGEN